MLMDMMLMLFDRWLSGKSKLPICGSSVMADARIFGLLEPCLIKAIHLVTAHRKKGNHGVEISNLEGINWHRIMMQRPTMSLDVY